MRFNNKFTGALLVAIFAFAVSACQTQPNASNSAPSSIAAVKAQSPTEAYKMLYAAVKAKNAAQVRQLMSKSSLGLADFSASQQKKTADQILENGLVAPTLAESISEIRDERVKDNFGAVEVFNPKDNRWEELPFVLEDGGWKLAVGDLFQDTYKSPGKSANQMASEAANTMTTTGVSDKLTNSPADGNDKSTESATDKKNKSVEVPSEDTPKK